MLIKLRENGSQIGFDRTSVKSKLCQFSIDKDHWPSNSPDLNPLDYFFWDELAEGMDWTQISTKQDLIDELHQAAKKVRQTVVFESCNTWTVRLWRISKNDGNYL